jgi:hypothetical protein
MDTVARGMDRPTEGILQVHPLFFLVWGKDDRRVVSFWALVADSLSPHDAEQLAEDLGIEHDTSEHVELERGPLCGVSKRR